MSQTYVNTNFEYHWLEQQVRDLEHYTALWAFLYKLDKRFGPMDPWISVKFAQRLVSRP